MNEVLEYLFFTESVANKFIKELQARELEFDKEIESVQGGIVLKVSEGVDDDLWDELDDLYDELSIEDLDH